MENVKVTICTQVYNTEPFLRRCVESVLHQTMADFTYILIDNGCTDGSGKILEEYAAQDSRIALFHLAENERDPWLRILRENIKGKYCSTLDSDDWLEPNYLECLLKLAEENNLDIACTGSAFHIEGQEGIIAGVRKQRKMIIETSRFAQQYPYYHTFFRSFWGKIIRQEIFLGVDYKVSAYKKLSNGLDTVLNFAWLRKARLIGIDDSVLHHYLMRKQSVYNSFRPGRFYSVAFLYKDAVDFLSRYGPISEENQSFISQVYCNGLYDALVVMEQSTLTPAERLLECRKAAEDPAMRTCLQQGGASAARMRKKLLQLSIADKSKTPADEETLRVISKVALPKCEAALDGKSVALFLRDPSLLNALFQDDWDSLTEQLMGFICQKRYTKQWDLGGILQSLIPDNNPLKAIGDTRFFRSYPEICLFFLSGNTVAALDAMTGLLLDGKNLYSGEAFLTLYLRTAALEGQENAFIFGNIRLADWYLRAGRREECGRVLNDLSEMGVTDNPEIAAIRSALAKYE